MVGGMGPEEDEEVLAEAQEVVKSWQQVVDEAHLRVQAVLDCGKDADPSAALLLPRLNAQVQDRLAAMRSLMLRLELVAQQHPSEDESESLQLKLEEWREQEKAVRSSLRNANIRAKLHVEEAVKNERELLLAGGEEATIRQRKLQTKAGMTGAAESITESLRYSRQMMIQEAERGASTLAALDCSNTTLKKAETEYKGHRSLLSRTRNLLATLRRQDVLDRIILVVGSIFFLVVCSYIFNKRIGLLKMRRQAASLPPLVHEEFPVPDYVDYPGL